MYDILYKGATGLISAIGTDYGPYVGWYPNAHKIYAVKKTPDVFFDVKKRVKGLAPVAFELGGAISKGEFDVTHADWEEGISLADVPPNNTSSSSSSHAAK